MIGFDEDKQIFVERRLHFSVTLWGAHDQVRAVDLALREKFGRSRLARIMWWYQAEHGPDYRSITMEPPPPIHDSFYPWLGEPVGCYLDRYLASPASVLFLMGEPGTGKTSLIRHLIYERQLKAVITYEEKLINSDEMFVDFLAQDGDAVLVVEDAETLLGSRDRGGNSLMARFLNVSDGLLRMSGKKIIFTTNQNDFRSVDPALVRPGRSFDALRARALTYEEACLAAADAGISPPGRVHRDHARRSVQSEPAANRAAGDWHRPLIGPQDAARWDRRLPGGMRLEAGVRKQASRRRAVALQGGLVALARVFLPVLAQAVL